MNLLPYSIYLSFAGALLALAVGQRSAAAARVVALLTALASQSIGHSIRESFGLPAGRLGAAVELASVGLVYCGLILLAIRFTAETTLRESVGVLPAPAARAINRLLGLR